MKSFLSAVLLAALLVGAPAASRGQDTATTHARQSAATHVALASGTRDGRAASSTASAAEIAAVRRQPKALLAGIALTRAEKKAVTGILRRNDRALKALADRDPLPMSDPARRARFERDVAAIRDRERAELRAALNPAHRVRFDRNLAQLDAH
jgi:hypothetical protein